jgi:hypothetical protein
MNGKIKNGGKCMIDINQDLIKEYKDKIEDMWRSL